MLLYYVQILVENDKSDIARPQDTCLKIQLQDICDSMRSEYKKMSGQTTIK